MKRCGIHVRFKRHRRKVGPNRGREYGVCPVRLKSGDNGMGREGKCAGSRQEFTTSDFHGVLQRCRKLYEAFKTKTKQEDGVKHARTVGPKSAAGPKRTTSPPAEGPSVPMYTS